MAEREDFSAKDAFWDLDALLPAREKRQEARPARRDTEAVSVSVPSTLTKVAAADSLFVEHPVPPHSPTRVKAPEPLFSYAPENTLLHEVRVYPWRTEYDYYEQFCRDARRFAAYEGKEAPPVEFFAYVPQYTQMNTAQLNYYFWWRQNFHEGKCLSASFSYLLLYLYEVINLGEAISPAEGQGRMLRLWISYREQHPRLDALVCEWLLDYSLLYRLPAPELPRALYRELIGGCKLKEFFVPLEENGDALATAVLLFCNNYDYTKSKFFTKETASDYHRVLRGAIGVALSYLRERDGNSLTGTSGISTVTRDAFVGAVCSYRLRRRIEVDYTSFSRTHELRYLMSDVLKYAENALRASRGIKSRLSIYALDTTLRARLDAYFVGVLPQRMPKNKTSTVEIPEYERRYDLPVCAPSRLRAAEIENESWETTKRLIEAFEEVQKETQIDKKPQDGASFSASRPQTAPPSPKKEASAEDGFKNALGTLCEFVRLAASLDAVGQRAFATKMGRMTDDVADEINTVAGDMLGDIILEQTDSGAYGVIEDYQELLQELGVL